MTAIVATSGRRVRQGAESSLERRVTAFTVSLAVNGAAVLIMTAAALNTILPEMNDPDEAELEVIPITFSAGDDGGARPFRESDPGSPDMPVLTVTAEDTGRPSLEKPWVAENSYAEPDSSVDDEGRAPILSTALPVDAGRYHEAHAALTSFGVGNGRGSNGRGPNGRGPADAAGNSGGSGTGQSGSGAGGDAPARLLGDPSRDMQKYFPVEARRRGLEGATKVRIYVDTGGRVDKVVVLESTPPGIFESAAQEGCRALMFKPAIKDGKPVAYVIDQIPILWKLPKS